LLCDLAQAQAKRIIRQIAIVLHFTRYGIAGRPNGLAFSGRLEGITSIDRERFLLHLHHKIAPIQPLRCNAGLGRAAHAARVFA
jgi:hypothetical protein